MVYNTVNNVYYFINYAEVFRVDNDEPHKYVMTT